MHRVSSYLFGLLAGASVLLSACARQEDHPASADADRYLRSFSMDIESVSTRAAIDFTSGAVSWNDGDRVIVYVPETEQSAPYRYEGGVFVPAGPEPLEIGDAQAFAYYPADAYAINKGQVTLTMPAAVTEDPGNKLPMGGIIPAGGIPSGKERREGTFKSLGSILWIKLNAVEGKEGTVTSVRIENSSLALTGKAPVAWNGETPVLGALSGEKAIEIACNKTLTTTAPAEFWLFVPAGDQQDMGLKLTLEKPGVQYSVEYHRNGTLSLSRNQVLPITFDVEGKSENGIASAEDFLAFAAAVNAGASTAEW